MHQLGSDGWFFCSVWSWLPPQASGVSTGLEDSRWLTHVSGSLPGLTRRLDTVGPLRDLSPHCYASLLTYYTATRDSPKGKRSCLFKAWVQHCRFCHVLLAKHLTPHLSSSTVSSVPHVGLWQNVKFLISELADETEFLMFHIQTAKHISHPTRQQQNIPLWGLLCLENGASVQLQVEWIKVIEFKRQRSPLSNHVWHGLRHSGHPLSGLSVSGSLLPKGLALPKPLAPCAQGSRARKGQGAGGVSKSRELPQAQTPCWIQYNSHQITHLGVSSLTLSPENSLKNHPFRFYNRATILPRPPGDSDHGRCIHQNNKLLLHWTSVRFHQSTHSRHLSLYHLPLPQSHRHFSDSPLVIQMTTLIFVPSSPLYAHSPYLPPLLAIPTCLHLCSPLHLCVPASSPRQEARAGNKRNTRLSDTFSSSNTKNHAKEMTQKRSQRNQDFSAHVPEYTSVLSLSEMGAALFR